MTFFGEGRITLGGKGTFEKKRRCITEIKLKTFKTFAFSVSAEPCTHRKAVTNMWVFFLVFRRILGDFFFSRVSRISDITFLRHVISPKRFFFVPVDIWSPPSHKCLPRLPIILPPTPSLVLVTQVAACRRYEWNRDYCPCWAIAFKSAPTPWPNLLRVVITKQICVAWNAPPPRYICSPQKQAKGMEHNLMKQVYGCFYMSGFCFVWHFNTFNFSFLGVYCAIFTLIKKYALTVKWNCIEHNWRSLWCFST